MKPEKPRFSATLTSFGLLCLVLTCLSGCQSLLGIEDRKLDVSELTADGYEGCEPSNGVCEACTSSWHNCICEGWKSKPEAVLRRDCADQAPAEIRKDVQDKAEEEYEEYRASRDGGDGKSDDDDSKDDGKDASDDSDSNDRGDGGEADDSDDGSSSDDGSENDDSTNDDSTGGNDDSSIDSGKPHGVDISDLEHFNDDFCDGMTPDACLGCFCGECGSEIEDCQNDRACAEIADCSFGNECDPGAIAGAQACTQDAFCGSVIADNGGVQAPAFQLFRTAMLCVADSDCPCGDAPPDGMGGGPPGCNPVDGCNACRDCWTRCFCEGKNDTECRGECGSPECTPDTGCNQCSDCLDQCLCSGQDRMSCTESCVPGGPDCRPDRGCDCDNCFDACQCDGGTAESCELDCTGFVGSICDPYYDCAECLTCGGNCYCSEPGRPLNECLYQCETGGCTPDDCSQCDSCQARCECEGRDPQVCLDDCQGLKCDISFASACDSCACERCTSHFAACEEISGCPDLMACIERTGCWDINDCDQDIFCSREIASLGGRESDVMGIVEALQWCRLVEYCPCFGPPPGDPGQAADILCGDATCSPFVPPTPDPIAQACCPFDGESSCGYDAAPLFGGQYEGTCLPRNSEGRDDANCPTLEVDFPPFDDEVLRGCCMPGNVCGLRSSVIDLGCIAPEFFGVASTDGTVNRVECEY